MANPKDSLQSKFDPSHRYANFGDVITGMQVKGFRCHQDTIIEVQSPITAFCGLNGTGKSTLLHLLAAAYKARPNEWRYHVRGFFVAGKLDTPFTNDASVKLEYEQSGKPSSKKIVTISRATSRWSGYSSQPARRVYFAGVGYYLPKIEIRDATTRYASSLTVSSILPIDPIVRGKVATILGCSYTEADENEIKLNGKRHTVVTVDKGGAKYSEANMGCGEGRIYHIVRALENLPDKSLVLLEEPEISLHPSAEHEFGKYLVDVCLRKNHQIFLTTHSENLLQALPEKSRLFLMRDSTGLQILPGIAPKQARSLMSNFYDPAFDIVVEDDVARAIVTELLLRHDHNFLKTVKISEGGGKTQIKTFMNVYSRVGKSVCIVLDGDESATPSKNIFKLFGTQAPEKEIFSQQAVRDALVQEYHVDWFSLDPVLSSMDHHDWFDEIERITSVPRMTIIHTTVKAYLGTVPEADRLTLIQQIKDAAAA